MEQIMKNEIYLTIEGKPEQEVQVWYRGDRDADIDDPAPIVFTGILGTDGRISVRVPRAYLCIGYPEKQSCQPHNFYEEKDDRVTVRLGSEDDEKIKESADHDSEAQKEAIAATAEDADLDNIEVNANIEANADVALRPWRVARSLLTLRNQVNLRAPNRIKTSDGTIGDERHMSRNSDHNAWIIDGANRVVSAMDITHDTAHGCDANALAEAIRAARDGRVKYIIWNRRICSSYPIDGVAAWVWRNYTGENPHTRHIHISVKSDKPNYDSTAAWAI
jgi:hypothetical protein